ncbi:MAG: transglutaminase domain-containing protein [Bacteroidaceae bacterium]|nr:transglutaminase domain-containing protein [Bacteroidaceae bacterium]
MKRISNLLILLLLAVFVQAQEKKDVMYITFSDGEVVTFSVNDIKSITFNEVEAGEDVVPSFPQPDGAERLNPYNNQETAAKLLNAAGVECTDTMGKIVITPVEYQEIKTFTDKLVAGCTTQKEIHDKCFIWISGNVKYGTEYSDGKVVNNDPYPVFTKKIAVCQGYANLLFVMLHTQNVPVLVTNGYLNGYGVFGGHAWNYVNCDETWYVSDPTNGGIFKMSELSDYTHLIPVSFDLLLFEQDDCQFDFNEARLNICSVKTNSRYFATPFSVGGYQVSSFSPTTDLPDNVRELFIGKNIETFGIERIGLNKHGMNVEYIHVDPEHTTLRSHAGIIYEKENNTPKLIPAAMKSIELLPVKEIGKNTVYNHNGVEVVYIVEGTENVAAWAFENCPNLKKAYIHKSVKVDESAFFNVHPDFDIIYTE